MYQLLAITVLSALAAGCASLSSSPAGTTDAGITLEMQSNALVFRDVRVETTPQGSSQVTGTLRRIGHRPVRAGHLDYRLTDASGRVLEEGEASDGGVSQRQHRHAWAFSIPLKGRWIPGQHHLYLKWNGAAHATRPPNPPLSPTGTEGQP